MGLKIKMECDVCNMEFNKTEFKKHQLIHKADSYKCDHCDAAFKHLKHRENHMKSKHEIKEEHINDGKMNVSKKLEFEENTGLIPNLGEYDEPLSSKINLKTPKKEARTPYKHSKPPKKETKTPKKETKTPKKETKTPKKETKTPKKETKTPLKFKNLKVDNCIGCKKSFLTVAALILHMKTTPECENKQKISDDLKWVKEGSEHLKKLLESDPDSKEMDTTKDNKKFNEAEVKITSFEHIFAKTSFGSSKPKKIAYVKPQVKEVSEDSKDEHLKKTDNSLSGLENHQIDNSSMSNFSIPMLQQDQHQEQAKFKCDQCGDKSRDMWEMKEHFISKHGSEDMYHDFRRKRKQKVKMLMERARISNLVKSEENKKFDDNISLLDKDEERKKVATFPCEFCENRFKKLKSLKKHKIYNHEETEKGDAEKSIDNDSTMETSSANLESLSSEGTFIIQKENSKRKRKDSCRECKACKAEDCGVCVHCKDKPKFGGPSKMKQKCLRRICLESGITPMKRKMLKKLERELEMSIQEKMLSKKRKSEPVFSVRNDIAKTVCLKKNKTEILDKQEKEGKSPGIKLKIKLQSSFSNSDSPEKWASEIISSDKNRAKDNSPKKRTNNESCETDESMHKKIKIEPDTEVDMEVSEESATSDEVDKLIKSEVEEILEMQKNFSEDLKKLIESETNGDSVFDMDNEVAVPVPPKTPQKCLENTIEKLKNRIGKDDYLAEEKVLEMLLNDTPAPNTRSSEKLLEESPSPAQRLKSWSTIQEAPGKDAANHEDDANLGYAVGDINRTEDANVITLYPTAAADVPAIDPEVEKFEKLKLISRQIVNGDLDLSSASSFTGLGERVLRCWLEAIQHVLEVAK